MMNFKAFHMSERGESHLHDGRVCQDSSASFSDECGTVAVVSDGHGGRDYVRSQIGSAMACEAAVKYIRQLFENISPEAFLSEPDMMLTQLEAAIINDWLSLSGAIMKRILLRRKNWIASRRKPVQHIVQDIELNKLMGRHSLRRR